MKLENRFKSTTMSSSIIILNMLLHSLHLFYWNML